MSVPLPTTQTPTPTFTVKSVLDVPAQEPTRLGKMDALITYQTDPLHSYTIRLPAENLSKDLVMAAIRADYAKRSPIINLSFQ